VSDLLSSIHAIFESGEELVFPYSFNKILIICTNPVGW